ncbi:hypothetical protein FEM48_Zijuj03G0155600 [Ziziphus jujuba var. spinosa]|uniref:Uncharacterized protein n=1 Tax=Ziziphus jujuba var. spinosa TaxID=714518 RepID=A0A978VR50_ZIZJJ|nr:hypothetical protein FEM48_Zijuj03G0155600 [Ziziphus jujuba var. spinosa]
MAVREPLRSLSILENNNTNTSQNFYSEKVFYSKYKVSIRTRGVVKEIGKMGFLGVLCFIVVVNLSFLIWKLLNAWWICPIRRYRKLKRNGFGGPAPSFPFGNTSEMKRKATGNTGSCNNNYISHDIHPTVFPYFDRWQKVHGTYIYHTHIYIYIHTLYFHVLNLFISINFVGFR